MSKTFAVLYIYDLLRNHQNFKLKDIVNLFQCSSRTASRYIADLKEYFKEFNLPYDIQYDAGEKTFKLIKIEVE